MPRAAMQAYYVAFRDELDRLATGWTCSRSGSDSDAIAKLLLSVLLGTVVQSAILEDATVEDIARGLFLLAR